jgi:hypothetical protein
MTTFESARKKFHRELASKVFLVDSKNVPTNADSDNNLSIEIARALAAKLSPDKCVKRPSGQTLGRLFEQACLSFCKDTFLPLKHLRPGRWVVESGKLISDYDQYAQLREIAKLLKDYPEIKSSLGTDYIIAPDILISREPESDASINTGESLVDDSVALLASLREKNNKLPILHASISCKWTMRSDRAQNSRSEALNLIRNRKGPLPHVIAITAEPLPSRLASLALGTGDLDCVYHFALYELIEILKDSPHKDAEDMLTVMVQGKRLRDVSDLPLDLAT